MGGAYSPLATDVNALYYNPGGMGFVRQGEIALMHNEYFEDVNHEYLGFVYPGFYNGTVGLDISYVDLGSFQRTTVGAGNAPVLGGTFDASDLAMKVAFGRCYNPELSWGVGLKYIRETLDSIDAQGWATDLGVMYQPSTHPGLSFGLAVLNLGPKVSYQNRKERLPLQWRGGVGYRVQSMPITLALEGKKALDSDWGMGVGGEYVFNDCLAVRLGYDSLMDAGSGFNCGVGFKMDVFSIDYAYEPTDDLGDVHRISLNILFGEVVEPRPQVPYGYGYGYRQQPYQRPQEAAPQNYNAPRAYAPAAAPATNTQVTYQQRSTAAPIYVAPPPAQPQRYY